MHNGAHAVKEYPLVVLIRVREEKQNVFVKLTDLIGLAFVCFKNFSFELGALCVGDLGLIL